MYLEEYYILKSHYFLVDKILSKSFFFHTSNNFNLTYKIKFKSKKSNVIFIFLLLLLTFLNSFLFKLKNHFIITLISLNDIFMFLNRFILILLPFCVNNKNLFFIDYFNLNSLTFFFKSFPLISEIEQIIELNKFYISIIKEIESKLIINVSFINIFHKESLCHILKFPLYNN